MVIGAGAGGATRGGRGFSLIELLIVIAIIMLLVAITLPAVRYARSRARDTLCTSNLRSVGQAIHSFVDAHGDHAAPCIRERDYYWDRGEQIGWDIQTGRWANIPGGPGTIWQCPAGQTAYMGNARALGLDCRKVNPDWPLYLVGPSRWYEPALLVLTYDLQTDLADFLPNGRDPYVGDLSDEEYSGWPRDVPDPVVPLRLDLPVGPHRGSYGVLFADGHTAVGRFDGPEQALWWSGPRWWP